MATNPIELASFFDAAEATPEQYDQIADAAHASFHTFERFDALVRAYRERVEQGRGEALRLALGLLILGKFTEALEYFERAAEGKLRSYFAASAALGAGRLDVAQSYLEQAARQGWDPVEISMRRAAVQIRAGDLSAAENLSAKHQHEGQDRASWYHVRGLLAEARGERVAAIASFAKTLALDPQHTEAMFRCARLYDLCGNDESALALYGRLARQPRAHVNALLNAAVIYEDVGRYDEAIDCLRRVLRAYPNHARARLFLKDVESCQSMVIEEGVEPRTDVRARLLDTPLSEFELSVRARNCLKKMNIRTLGELIHLTEAELLAYKNFGETSLTEIKALLTKRGLFLGMSADEVPVDVAEMEIAARKAPVLPAGQEAILSKSVSEIELSVRARRCLQRLNVQTLADLVQYSESDLLSTRNFGVTSLSEIKARLVEHGLQLAPKKTP
jgi:DNA-directed RNA polymerase subunit alpha